MPIDAQFRYVFANKNSNLRYDATSQELQLLKTQESVNALRQLALEYTDENLIDTTIFDLMEKHELEAKESLEAITKVLMNELELRRTKLIFKPFILNPTIQLKVISSAIRIDDETKLTQPITTVTDGGFLYILPNKRTICYGWYLFMIPAKVDDSIVYRKHVIHYRSISPLSMNNIRDGGGIGIIHNSCGIRFPNLDVSLGGIASGTLRTEMCNLNKPPTTTDGCILDLRINVDIGGSYCALKKEWDSQYLLPNDTRCFEYTSKITNWGE